MTGTDDIRDAAGLSEELGNLGLSLSPLQIQGVSAYLDELDRWNRKVNLTALSGRMRIRRLVAEPIWIASQLGIAGNLADIGSGNGSPAVPIALTRPLQSLVLVEPRLKRAAFLRQIAGIAGVPVVRIERARIENIQWTNPVDWITMQGVALTSTLMDGLKRLCSETTRVVWITSNSSCPAPGATRMKVPGSGTEAWWFVFNTSELGTRRDRE